MLNKLLIFISLLTVSTTIHGAQFCGGIGLTFGGTHLRAGNNNELDLQAGELIHIYAGSLIPLTEKLHTRISLGFHYHSQQNKALLSLGSEQAGQTSFTRMPLDLTMFYTAGQLRTGLGVSLHLAPVLDSTDFGGERIEFDNAAGLLGEAGWNVDRNFWLSFRYLAISYSAKQPTTYKINGDHAGVYLSLVF